MSSVVNGQIPTLARLRLGRTAVIAAPTIWLGLFFAAPFLVVLSISLADPQLAMPPYSKVWEWRDGWLRFNGDLENYRFVAEDNLYLLAYLSSLKFASVSTLCALLIGYPMALVIARAQGTWRNLLLLAVILPFWTSFLLRVYAWIGILKTNGLLNALLLKVGLISEPLVIMQTDLAVYIGITYTYLPFMILPLYANLVKIDGALVEAASDLGARPFMNFLTVTLPLSFPGIFAGCLLVFIPAVGEFVIPRLLGGADTLMIGEVLWDEFRRNRDWPVASTVAAIMLVVLVAPILLFRSIQQRQSDAT